ncbi:tetratricopeptide (TPR) repeat protein [Sphingomonas sp. UYAg733]
MSPLSVNSSGLAAPGHLRLSDQSLLTRRFVLAGGAATIVTASLTTGWALAAAPTTATNGEALLDKAQEAFGLYDLALSRRHLEAVGALPGIDRPTAGRALRTLADYDWRFDRDPRRATRRLAQALAKEPGSPTTLVQRARLFHESGQPALALEDVQAAIKVAAEGVDRSNALVLHAQIETDPVRRDPNAPAMQARAALAITDLNEVLRRQPGRSDAAEALVGIGVAAGNGSAILNGVLAYHFIANAAAATGIMVAPVTALASLVRDWRAAPLTNEERRRLALALAGARFYKLAAQVAEPVVDKDPELRALIAYRDYLLAVASVNTSFYPRVANGLRNYEAAYDAAMAKPAETLLLALDRKPPTQDRSPKAILDVLFPVIAKHFGAEGYFGTTVNFYGMLAGHTVVDDRRTVQQYGHSAEFRFISLDQMISRDFTSWYGTTNVGGWGTESTMIQVRQAYLTAPYAQLAWVTDPAALATLEKRISVLELADLKRCGADPYAEPDAAPLRIRLEASRRIANGQKRNGALDGPAAVGFIAEVLRLTTEATVFAHEGRHSLDQTYRAEAFKTMSDDERELRAKYSEIAFSQDPRYALTGSIIGGHLDESSGHGRANRRFRELLVRWMEAHRAEIEHLVPDRPLIMQIDLLSDAQLRSFVAGADKF